MSAAAAIEQFTAVRVRLDAACGLLMEPTAEALDRCSILLESAGHQMADFRSKIGEVQGDPIALEAAWGVRRAFLRAASLFKGVASFHGGWMAVRGAMTGGYTNRGEPAPVRHPGRIWVEA